MSDENALLAAIRAHPDEDTPRLIYADWLQENGDPEYAEFIRLQCAPELIGTHSNRLYELNAQFSGRWLTLPRPGKARWVSRRGFPEQIRVDLDVFLNHFSTFERVSWLRALLFYRVQNAGVIALCNCEWPRQWIELELIEEPNTTTENNYDPTPALDALANSAQVGHLRRLRLSRFTLGQHTAQALTALQRKLGDRLVFG